MSSARPNEATILAIHPDDYKNLITATKTFLSAYKGSHTADAKLLLARINDCVNTHNSNDKELLGMGDAAVKEQQAAGAAYLQVIAMLEEEFDKGVARWIKDASTFFCQGIIRAIDSQSAQWAWYVGEAFSMFKEIRLRTYGWGIGTLLKAAYQIMLASHPEDKKRFELLQALAFLNNDPSIKLTTQNKKLTIDGARYKEFRLSRHLSPKQFLKNQNLFLKIPLQPDTSHNNLYCINPEYSFSPDFLMRYNKLFQEAIAAYEEIGKSRTFGNWHSEFADHLQEWNALIVDEATFPDEKEDKSVESPWSVEATASLGNVRYTIWNKSKKSAEPSLELKPFNHACIAMIQYVENSYFAFLSRAISIENILLKERNMQFRIDIVDKFGIDTQFVVDAFNSHLNADPKNKHMARMIGTIFKAMLEEVGDSRSMEYLKPYPLLALTHSPSAPTCS